MKYLIICLASLIYLDVFSQETINVMTLNIRLDLASDSLNGWPYRKEKVASQVLFHQATIVGVQEALPEQMKDLQILLKQYRSVGVGREDGKQKGEFSAIFYDTTRLNLLASETFWLSQTPNIAGSKGWDAALPRIVTWAKFKDKTYGKIFFQFNTHFDHMGKEARRQSSLLILHAVDSIAQKLPVLVLGDFNALPDEDPIRLIVEPSNPLHLLDTEKLSELPPFGPRGTYNGWKIDPSGHKRIDYIFCRGNIGVKRYGTIAEIREGRYSSDHFPVMAEVVIR